MAVTKVSGVDMNGLELILDADADTSITADTDDQIDIKISGADDFQFTANTFTVLSGSTLTVASGATIANSGTATGFGGSDPSSADGDTLGTASLEWSDLYLADGGVIYFGNDQEVKLTHVADTGLTLKHTATADDKPIVLTLQTGETDMAASDIIGALQFQAPDEGTGTDAVLVSGAVKAYAEGDHSSSSNATSLAFYTGASEVATEKMTIKSDGKVGIGVTGSSIDEILHIFSSTNDSRLKMECTGGNSMIDIVGNRTSDADIGHLLFSNGATNLALLRAERSGANDSGKLKIQTSNGGSMASGLEITKAGEVTKPQNPCFLGLPASVQTNLGTGETTISFGTEVFDIGSNYDQSVQDFTAPVTGKYLVAYNIKLMDMDEGANYYQVYIKASNATRYGPIIDPGAFDLDADYWGLGLSVILDMDADDTVYLNMYRDGGGGAQTDIGVDSMLSIALLG